MGFFSMFSNEVSDVQAAIDRNLKRYRRVSKESTLKGLAYIDKEEKYFYFNEVKFTDGLDTPKVFRLDKLESYKVIENDEELLTGGLSLKRAVVGSVIAGPAGMVLGGVTGDKKTKKKINALALIFKLTNGDSHIIRLIKKPIDAESVQYVQLKNALQITSDYFESVLDKQRNE